MSVYVGAIVGIHGLQRETRFNGDRGVIVGWSDSARWLVSILGRGGSRHHQIAIKPCNLFMVNKRWLDTTQAGMFNQAAMLGDFKAPSPWDVPDFAVFTTREAPNLEVTQAFWGSQCYHFMKERLMQNLQEKRGSNKGMGLFREFLDRPVDIGLVFSDGLKATQSSPINDNDAGSWWPAVFPAGSAGCLELVSAFCQAQAVNGARPWPTHSTRIHVFRLVPAPSYQMTSTVIIEEIDSDESDDEPENEFQAGVVIENAPEDEPWEESMWEVVNDMDGQMDPSMNALD